MLFRELPLILNAYVKKIVTRLNKRVFYLKLAVEFIKKKQDSKSFININNFFTIYLLNSLKMNFIKNSAKDRMTLDSISIEPLKIHCY